MAGVRNGAVENLVSSLEEVALSDVGPGPLKLSAALSHPSLQLSLGTPLLLCLCSLSAEQMLNSLLLRVSGGQRWVWFHEEEDNGCSDTSSPLLLGKL